VLLVSILAISCAPVNTKHGVVISYLYLQQNSGASGGGSATFVADIVAGKIDKLERGHAFDGLQYRQHSVILRMENV
jgi:hypothetical protein